MHAGDKIAAAILASAAIRTIPGVRLNSMELQDLYRHFLQVVGAAGAEQPQPLRQEIWNGREQQHDEPIGIGIGPT
jgi:hypothetical protein